LAMGCFDPFVCPPTNKLCANGDAPVGGKNKLEPALTLGTLNGGSAPILLAPPAPGVAKTEARNGFTVPTPAPVTCGRSPTPIVEPPPPVDPTPLVGNPVGCVPRPKLPPRPAPTFVAVHAPGVDNDALPRFAPSPTPVGTVVALAAGDEAGSRVGVVGADCGIGGSVSSSDAPNDDVGLNVLIPALKPVVCGRSGGMPVGWLDIAVFPVGCPLSELKMESEKVEPVAVVEAVMGIAVVVVLEVSDGVVS
jgi:hypothetical protein